MPSVSVAAWEALVCIALGIGVALVGRHYRKQYFGEFADLRRESEDPAFRMTAQLMRRCVAMFLTAGTMMVIVGIYFLLFP